jgi:hypothetical protein
MLTTFWLKSLKGGVYSEDVGVVKVKLSRYTPWRHMGGEEV